MAASIEYIEGVIRHGAWRKAEARHRGHARMTMALFSIHAGHRRAARTGKMVARCMTITLTEGHHRAYFLS
jgi:hypothetical protein